MCGKYLTLRPKGNELCAPGMLTGRRVDRIYRGCDADVEIPPTPNAGRNDLCALELLLLGAPGQGHDGGIAPADGLRDRIKIACSDFALMLGCGIAVLLSGKLGLLEPHIGAHLLRLVVARQLKHREVERMEAGKRDELEAVAHGAEFPLKLRDREIIELALPVEGG